MTRVFAALVALAAAPLLASCRSENNNTSARMDQDYSMHSEPESRAHYYPSRVEGAPSDTDTYRTGTQP